MNVSEPSSHTHWPRLNFRFDVYTEIHSMLPSKSPTSAHTHTHTQNHISSCRPIQERRKPSQHGSAVPEHSQIDYVVCAGESARLALRPWALRRAKSVVPVACQGLWLLLCPQLNLQDVARRTSAKLPDSLTRLSLFSWNAFLSRWLYLTFTRDVKLYTVHFKQEAGCMLQISSWKESICFEVIIILFVFKGHSYVRTLSQTAQMLSALIRGFLLHDERLYALMLNQSFGSVKAHHSLGLCITYTSHFWTVEWLSQHHKEAVK